MTRDLGRLWIVTFGFAIALAPMAFAQDMTGTVVTDPPAPVADGYATFTGTYQNLGLVAAETTYINYYVGVSPETWPIESPGWTALYDSTEGTDTNGNDVFSGIDRQTCNHWVLQLQRPNDTGDQDMFPIPPNGGGSFSWQLPVIPMEGVTQGRFVITEPESLRNSFEVIVATHNAPYSTLGGHAGLYSLIMPAMNCDDGGDNCEDLDACLGDRLWSIEPIETELEIGMGTDDDPEFGCGSLVGFTAGNIAIVRRGGVLDAGANCSFVNKMQTAQDAGAAGLIVVNAPAEGTGQICGSATDFDVDECVTNMGSNNAGDGYLIHIPSVMMGRRQGEELIAALQGGQTIRTAMGPIPSVAPYFEVWAVEDADTNTANNTTAFRAPLGEMGPTEFLSFVPAAALAAGAEGAFFQTDLDINNKGAEEATVTLLWLPRGENNATPAQSDPIVLGPGQSIQYENVLNAVFGLEPDVAGAIAMIADSADVIGMSRTYNVPGAKIAGTFGQGLPAIPSDQLIPGAQVKRIIFMSENDDIRANVGCVNGLATPLRINLELYNAAGTLLETRTMDLAPWSNNQINRIFRNYQPVNGYVDVSTQTEGAAFYCYGSVLDNLTSDPTTVLPQVTSDDFTFIPAAALAAGAQGAFFQTDVDLNNAGTTAAQYNFIWLPRGEDNSNLDPLTSDPFTLEPGASVRYENVLNAVFGAEPDVVGALAVSADSADLLAMSRTYNIPGAKVAGTFGQELPGIPADMMIATGEKKRIIFMNENDDVRANVGCQNGVNTEVVVNIQLFSADGTFLETKYMTLAPWSNNQINRVFRNYAPVNGYVDIWTTAPDATIYCYGSVLDNLTSDPTTVLPQ